MSDLEIYFEDPILIDQQIAFRKQSASEDPEETKNKEKKRIAQEELDIKTDQLQNMIVTDPAEFENLLTQDEEMDGRGDEGSQGEVQNQ